MSENPLHYEAAEIAEGIANSDPLAGLKEAVERAGEDDRTAIAVRFIREMARAGMDDAVRLSARAWVKKLKLIEPIGEFDKITARPTPAARPDPAPAVPVPDDPAALLHELRAWLVAYVAFPSPHHAVAVALWIAHTHLAARFDATGRLVLLSPEPECGKTRVLELAVLTCAGAELLNDASPAYLFRRISDGPVTLLIDECDAIWKRGKSDETAEALRSIVNAGHRKGAIVGRVDMNAQGATLARYPVYAPAALAAKGSPLPDTVMSRAVVIHMRRRPPGEQLRRYRERITRPEGDALREQIAAWAAAVADRVGDPWPDLPDGLDDRPADVWEPLLAVAALAGGDWPDLAREACVALVAGARDDSQTTSTRLLADLRSVFGGVEALATETILGKLRALDESPWGDWYGHPLTARDLARLLRQFRAADDKPVRPRVVRIGESTPRGYRAEDLADAWHRYLTPQVSATSATSATPLASDVALVADVADTPAGCVVCGEPLDSATAADGYATHPGCDPGEEPPSDHDDSLPSRERTDSMTDETTPAETGRAEPKPAPAARPGRNAMAAHELDCPCPACGAGRPSEYRPPASGGPSDRTGSDPDEMPF